VAVLDAPVDWPDVSAGFSSFSPKGDRLAAIRSTNDGSDALIFAIP
jgi:hypothetical protein